MYLVKNSNNDETYFVNEKGKKFNFEKRLYIKGIYNSFLDSRFGRVIPQSNKRQINIKNC